jgi:hypothetical protein
MKRNSAGGLCTDTSKFSQPVLQRPVPLQPIIISGLNITALPPNNLALVLFPLPSPKQSKHPL